MAEGERRRRRGRPREDEPRRSDRPGEDDVELNVITDEQLSEHCEEWGKLKLASIEANERIRDHNKRLIDRGMPRQALNFLHKLLRMDHGEAQEVLDRTIDAWDRLKDDRQSDLVEEIRRREREEASGRDQDLASAHAAGMA